jgi:hypothetical protein
VLACQGAGIAVFGVYPLVFTTNGYHGQINWLLDTAACTGDKANSVLLSSSREGELILPQHVQISLPSGQTVQLGPDLLTPTDRSVRRMRSLYTSIDGACLVVKQVGAEQEEEDDEEVPEEKAEAKDEDDDDKDFDDTKKLDKEERARRDAKESEDLKIEDEKNRKKVYIDMDKLDVTEEQLRGHMVQFGDVDTIYIPEGPFSNFGVVTMASPVVAGALLGARHTLQRSSAEGGKAVLRLRGGSGRMPRAPPQQQQQLVCPFR